MDFLSDFIGGGEGIAWLLDKDRSVFDWGISELGERLLARGDSLGELQLSTLELESTGIEISDMCGDAGLPFLERERFLGVFGGDGVSDEDNGGSEDERVDSFHGMILLGILGNCDLILKIKIIPQEDSIAQERAGSREIFSVGKGFSVFLPFALV